MFVETDELVVHQDGAVQVEVLNDGQILDILPELGVLGDDSILRAVVAM